MKRIALVLLALLLGVSGVEAGPRSPTVKLLRSDSQRIVLELTIPDFRVISREHGGTTYQAVVVPDLEQTWEPGQPQVPFKGVLLGVPSSGQVQVSVLESAYETHAGLMLYPSPRPIVQEEGGGTGSRSRVCSRSGGLWTKRLLSWPFGRDRILRLFAGSARRPVAALSLSVQPPHA